MASAQTWIAQPSGIQAPLNAVHFADSLTGWAAGGEAAGALLKTENGGTFWAPQTLPSSMGWVASLSFIGRDSGWAMGRDPSYKCVVARTTNGGVNWTALATTRADNFTCGALRFLDAGNGFLGGRFPSPGTNALMRTRDGGQTWSTVTLPIDDATLTGLHFPTRDTGYAIGSRSLLKSIDSGATWTRLSPGVSGFEIRDAFFANARTGWIAGSSLGMGLVLKTTNGGATWSRQPGNQALTIRAVAFRDSTTGFAAGDHAMLFRTLDGGASWDARAAKPSTRSANALFAHASGRTWAVGDSGLILRAQDSASPPHDTGLVATTLASGTNEDLKAVHFLTRDLGYVAGAKGTLRRTSDGGKTWTAVASGTSQTLNALFLVQPDAGYAVGNGGTLTENLTSNGWKTASTGTTRRLNAVQFRTTWHGYVAGDSGTVRRTTDGGATWANLSPPTRVSLTGLFFLDSLTGYVGGADSIFKTTNAGASWIALTLPDSLDPEGVLSLYFSSAREGYATAGGRVLRTRDSGATWSAVTVAEQLGVLRGVQFSTATLGHAAGTAGGIHRTTDGGETWQRISHPPEARFNALHFPTLHGGYAVGDSGLIAKIAGAEPTVGLHARAEPARVPFARLRADGLIPYRGRVFDLRGRARPASPAPLPRE